MICGYSKIHIYLFVFIGFLLIQTNESYTLYDQTITGSNNIYAQGGSCLFVYEVVIVNSGEDLPIEDTSQIGISSQAELQSDFYNPIFTPDRFFSSLNVLTDLGIGTFFLTVFQQSTHNVQNSTFTYQCDPLPNSIVNSNTDVGNWRYSGNKYYTYLKLNLVKTFTFDIVFSDPYQCDFTKYGYDILVISCLIKMDGGASGPITPTLNITLSYYLYSTIFNIPSFIKNVVNNNGPTSQISPFVTVQDYFLSFYYEFTVNSMDNQYLYAMINDNQGMDYKSLVLGNENTKTIAFYSTLLNSFEQRYYQYSVSYVNSSSNEAIFLYDSSYDISGIVYYPISFHTDTDPIIRQDNLYELPVIITGYYPFFVRFPNLYIAPQQLIEFPNFYISQVALDGTGVANFQFVYPTLGYLENITLAHTYSSQLVVSGMTQGSDTTLTPSLLSVQFIPLKGTSMLVRCTYKASESGLKEICVITDEFANDCKFKLEASDVVTGDIYDGSLEKYLDYSDFLLEGFQIEYSITNNALKTTSYSRGNNLDLPTYSQFPTNFPVLPIDVNLAVYFNISYVKFTLSFPDLSDLGSENRIYINFTNVIPGSKVKVILDVDNDKTVLATWNDEFQMFVGSFYLEANPFSGLVRYTVLYCGFTYDSAFLPDSFQLRVHSDYADRMPPIITSIIRNPTDIEDTEGGLIVWQLDFKDEPNGLKSYIIHITSSKNPYEPIVYKGEFGGIQTSGIIEIRLQVPANCVTQVYSISYIELNDNGNVQSIYNNLTLLYESNDQSKRIFNPIFNIAEPLSISVECGRPTEESTPTIETIFFSEESIDVGTAHRSVMVRVVVIENNILLTDVQPTCYLYSVNFKWVSTKGQFIDNNSFLCDFQDIPYGFGFPNTVLYLGVYGIRDEDLNYAGYTPLGLGEITSNSIAINFNNTNPIIEQVLPFSPQDGTVTVIGHALGDGSVPTNKVNVTYQDIPQGAVHSIIYISNSSIIFLFEPEVNQVIKSITFLGTSTVSNIFNTEISTALPSTLTCPGTPQPCTSISNGKCTKLGCQCIDDWSGVDCSSKVIIINPPVVNTTSPTIDTEIPLPNGEEVTLKSLISVQSLNEIDHDGTLVKSHIFNQWLFKDLTSTTNNLGYSEFLYSTTIDYNSVNTKISVNVKYFSKSQTIVFANEQIDMKPSTIKYSIDISKYGFTNSLNSLQLIMSATFQTSLEDSCTNIESGNSVDGVDGNNEYYKLRINSQSLYARFVKRGIIDNRVQTISNTLMNSTESTQTSSSVTNLISINIPHYLRSCQLDPDFSVLFDNRPVDKETPNSVCYTTNEDTKLTTSQIAGIIIGVIGFVAVVTISVIYYKYKKNEERSRLISIQQKMNQFK